MNGLIKSSRGKINPNSYFMLTSRSHTFAKIQAVRLPSTPFRINRSLQATVLVCAMVVSVSSVLFGFPQSAEAAVGDYTGFSFDTTGSGNNPYGIIWDDTYFWVVGTANAIVYKYNSNGTYASFSFGTAAGGSGDPRGITWDGTYFWVTDGSADVFKYNSNGTSASFSFDTAASGNGVPNGITWDGTYFWVTDTTDAEVYKYNSNGTYASFSFDTAASGNGVPFGITWDGTYFWVTDTTDAEVYKYNSNGTYANFSFDTAASGNGTLRDITWDGTYFWVTDYSGNEVYQYDAVSPHAPTALTTTSNTGSVGLSWTVPADNGTSNLETYGVWRHTSPFTATSSATLITSFATSTGTTYSDTTVSHGTVYYYSVTATNQAATSLLSNQRSSGPNSGRIIRLKGAWINGSRLR